MDNPITSLPDNPNAKEVYDYLFANRLKSEKELDGVTLPVGLVQIIIGRLAKKMKVGRPTIQHWLDRFEEAGVIVRPGEEMQRVLVMHYAPKNSNWFILTNSKSYDEISTKKKARKAHSASTLSSDSSALLAIAQTYVKSAISATYYGMKATTSKPSAATCACILSTSIECLLSLSNLLLSNSGLYAAIDSSANNGIYANSDIDADNDLYAALGIGDSAAIRDSAAISASSGIDATAAIRDSADLSATAACRATAATSPRSRLDATAATGLTLTSVQQMVSYIADWMQKLYQESNCSTPGERNYARTREAEAEIPSLRQVLNFAAKRKISEASAKSFYEHFNETGWKTTQGNYVYDWRARLVTWANSDTEYKQNLFRNEKRVEKIHKNAMNLKREVLEAVADGKLSPNDGLDAIVLGLNGQKPKIP